MKYCVTTTGLNSAKNGLKNDSVSLSWSHQRPPGSTYYQFKKIEIVSSIFSDHNALRLDINYRKISVKNTNTWRLNNTRLNKQEITEEIKEEIKKYLETSVTENTTTQNLWDAAKAVLRGTFIAIQSYLKKHLK